MGFSQGARSQHLLQSGKASHCFPPVCAPDARLLILGTLPGAISLREQQYYAHPQNAFWRIMGALIGAHPELPYEERLLALTRHRIALWDVCAAARREGSLDSDIEAATIVPNDFVTFLRTHPQVISIAFNGAKAHALFTRKVLPGLPAAAQFIRREILPSTSPARTLPLAQKLEMWKTVLHTALDMHAA